MLPILERNSSGIIVRAQVARWINTHVHTRPNMPRYPGMQKSVVPDIIRHCTHVVCQPNNGYDNGKTDSVQGALLVYGEILEIAEQNEITTFRHPLMTLNHTDNVTRATIDAAKKTGVIPEIKDYPVHPPEVEGTTGSGHGVPFDEDPELVKGLIANDMTLAIHAEDAVDENNRPLPYEVRSQHCYDHRLRRFREANPDLKIHIEHADIIDILNMVKEDTTGKTTCGLTPHHMWLSADDFKHSWGNDARNMPYLKTPEDRDYCLECATSGDPRFEAGDDYAPHPWLASKNPTIPFEKCACGCSLPHSLAMYFAAFNKVNALDERFTQFTMLNAAKRLNLRPTQPDDLVTIVFTNDDIPDPTPIYGSSDYVVPLGWTMNRDAPDRLKILYRTMMNSG